MFPLRLNITFLLLATSLNLWAISEKEISDFVSQYRRWRTFPRAGALVQDLESLYFMEAAVQLLPASHLERTGLQLIADRLVGFGYRISLVAVNDLVEPVLRARTLGPGQRTYLVNHTLRTRVNRVRKSGIPETKLPLTPSLAAYHFPSAFRNQQLYARQIEANLKGHLGRSPKDLVILFELLGSTKSGRELLGKFLPMLNLPTVSLVGLDNLDPQYDELFGTNAALYMGNPVTGEHIIYYDVGTEIGLLLIQLFHEIFHMVREEQLERRKAISCHQIRQNEQVAAWARRAGVGEGQLSTEDLSAAELSDYLQANARIEILDAEDRYLSERETHDAQDNFRRELEARFGEPVKAYYDAHLERQNLRTHFPDSFLLEFYKIPYPVFHRLKGCAAALLGLPKSTETFQKF